jgi:hypothetical protein
VQADVLIAAPVQALSAPRKHPQTTVMSIIAVTPARKPLT